MVAPTVSISNSRTCWRPGKKAAANRVDPFVGKLDRTQMRKNPWSALPSSKIGAVLPHVAKMADATDLKYVLAKPRR